MSFLHPNYIIFVILILFCTTCTPFSIEENSNEQKKISYKDSKVPLEVIETGIQRWIELKSSQNEGYFFIIDGDKKLQLTLVRVHTEYLSNLGPGRYFACVDLADAGGDVFDIDFFMEGPSDSMYVTETSVHKKNGRPYYAWKQKPDKTWYRLPMDTTANELMGIIEGTDQFEFYYEASLPEITSNAKLWIPIAKSDSFQQVKLISIEAPVREHWLKDQNFGNSILYMELTSEHSKKNITLSYQVERKEKGPYTDSSDPEDFLGPDNLIPVGGQFREIAWEAMGKNQTNSRLMQARAIYDYIIDNMRYMKYGNFGKGDAVYACNSGTGNCTEFHSFFLSLARSVNIPARFAIGASIPSDRDEGGIDGYHCWAEFFAEGKWWPVDISEANKYTALSTYYFGRHPANRFELSRGRDLVVEPGPESGPINFLAYPFLEIEGKPALVKTTFSFSRN